MAITKLNSLAIPPDTVVESDISFPLDSASFTGDLTVDTDTLVVDSTNNNVGIGEIDPATNLQIGSDTPILSVGEAFTKSKFDSLGTAYSANTDCAALVFNALATTRPEVAFYRGSRTYPEFAIRQNATADTGGTIYSGTGLSTPTATMTFNSGNVGINDSNPNRLLKVKSNGTNTSPITVANTAGTAEIVKMVETSVGDGRIDIADSSNVRKIQLHANGNSYFTGGNLLVGTTSPIQASKLTVRSDTINRAATFSAANTTTGNVLVSFESDLNTAGIKCLVRADGDLENINNSYGAFSDARLKSNIADASSQIDDIMAVQVRSYTLDSTGDTHIGVIAQELEETGMSGLVKTDDEGMKAVKYSVLYMKAIKALQEAVTRIETLEAEVAALKGAN